MESIERLRAGRTLTRDRPPPHDAHRAVQGGDRLFFLKHMPCPMLRDLPPPPPGKTGWPWTEASRPLPEAMPDGQPWPKVSIVTPSYNQGRFIEETIRSVLLQGYPNLEYFVIDGGSTDESVEIIEKYAPWIDYWVSEPDRGQSHAIDKGLTRCTGEIFNWLNSDDYYAPSALRSIAVEFAEPSVGIVSGRERRFGKGIASFIHPGSTVKDTLEETVFKGHNVQPCTFFRRAFLDRTGGVSTKLHYLMDMDLYMRYGLQHGQGGILKIGGILSNFRLHDESKTVTQRPLFENDRWTMRYSLAKQFGLSQDVLESTKKLFTISEHRAWQVTASFDADAYFCIYAKELLKLHYLRGNYTEGRRCLRFLQSMDTFEWNRSHVSYYLRLHLPVPTVWNSVGKLKKNISF